MQDRAVNPISPVIWAVAAVIVGVECVLQLGARGIVGGPYAIGWRLTAVEHYAFSPLVWDYVILRGDFGLSLSRRFVSYVAVHQTFTHMLFAAAILLALGKFVGDVLSTVNLVILLVLTTVGGAIVYGVTLEGAMPLFGAFPLVYGLIGSYTYLVWARLGAIGEPQLKAFRLIGVLLGLQLVFGLLYGPSPHWVAEMSGFAIGFASTILLAPGGWSAMLARTRNR